MDRTSRSTIHDHRREPDNRIHNTCGYWLRADTRRHCAGDISIVCGHQSREMTMGLQGVALGVILLLIHDSCAQIVLTQSPDLITVSPGETVTISCKASSKVGTGGLHWYQQKSGQRPALLIYGTSNRYTGVPDRFTGSGSFPDFILTISGATEDDAADYYCQQDILLYQQITLHPVIVAFHKDASPAVLTVYLLPVYSRLQVISPLSQEKQSPSHVHPVPALIIGKISKYEVNWYQIKEGQPKLLLYFAITRQTGITDRFSGTGSGNDFTLSIKGVTEDDAADYYCQSDYNLPLTQ
ncbi:unnamed protein product [Ranitomeya imitator]|uniref:Ig-like domain-containing protein n=1 Tax=Ranitomeya imitator TaxID=111125 RepID=A0ABN9LRI3_9NEOB|nr:unnamed protein product [Ranitomeya imitator]